MTELVIRAPSVVTDEKNITIFWWQERELKSNSLGEKTKEYGSFSSHKQ